MLLIAIIGELDRTRACSSCRPATARTSAPETFCNSVLLQSGRINGTLPRRRTSLVAGLEQGSLR
ncbi:hypothetical protein BVY10_14630, partial [Pseudomonas amygdali pv. morsprunorum]